MTAIKSADILLPDNQDYKKWACIACDQFTSEPKYWNELESFVGQEKSTLALYLPELYLNDEPQKRIAKINENIDKYLSEKVFREYKDCFVLVVRSTPFVKRRIGLVGTLDLETYEYSKKSSALVRSTEGTIEERIPPRLKIRENAKIELPHIMVLFDDEKREITEKLYEERNKLQKLYDFDLNMGGGHIEGYLVPKDNEYISAFNNLTDSERLVSKYGFEDKFMFAVGDGNHSLATAKTHWNKLKTQISNEEQQNHPARFALCEFVNIYDEGIYFEAIHRYVCGADADKFVQNFPKDCKCKIYCGGKEIEVCGQLPLPKTISSADEYIKEYISANSGCGIDYIHGDENVKKLVDEKGGVAVLFDKLDKSMLFPYVSKFGALPRKTFSMGEGVEKRYYIEAKKIVK